MKHKDPSPDKYTPTEILEQIALGNMDARDGGITQPIPIIGEQPDPANLRVLPQGPPKRTLGDKLEFQAGIVPLSLRAEWEAMDAKIIPFDKEAWIERNKDTYRIQAMLACGNGVLRLDQTFSNPADGLAAIMEAAAKNLRDAFTEQKAETTQNESTKKDVS